MNRQPNRKSGKMMSLIKRYITFGFIGLFVATLLLLVSVWIWQMRAGSEARSKLAAIKAKGLPTTPQEVNEFYDSLCEKPDITDEWLKLFELVSGEEIQNDYTQLLQKDKQTGAAQLIIYPPGETWPQQADVIGFLTKHQNVLEAIHNTLQKDGDARFPVDYRGVLKIDLSHQQNLRSLARLLLIDAAFEAHEGNGEKFVEAIEGVLDIANKFDKELTHIGALHRIYIQHLAVESLQHSLTRVEIPLSVIQRLKTRFSQPINYLKAYQRGLIGDRARMLDCFSNFENALQSKGENRFWKAFVNSDRCHYLDLMQLRIDICEFPFPDTRQATREFRSHFRAVEKKWPRPVLTLLLTPSVPHGIAAMCRRTFFDRACYIALAIEEYRVENKHFPESLDQLVPNHLNDVPQDPFDGQPIRYKLTDIGYKLYSVGPNLIDNGGIGPLFPDFVFEVPMPFKLVSDGDLIKPSQNYSGVWEVVSSNNQPRFKEKFRNGKIIVGTKTTFEGEFKNGKMFVGTETQIKVDGSEIITEYRDGKLHRRDVYSAPDPITEFVEHLANGTFKNDEPFEGTFCEWRGDEPQIIHYRNGERLPDERRN